MTKVDKDGNENKKKKADEATWFLWGLLRHQIDEEEAE